MEGIDTQFSVSWSAYQNSICNGLSSLQQRGEFVDMTIAADGHHVKVHQMVLSLVSPYIKELITSAPSSHPVIFLNRVSHQTLQAILEYAYTGVVLVSLDKLGEFLEACKALQIKGLENADRESMVTAGGDFHQDESSTANEHANSNQSHETDEAEYLQMDENDYNDSYDHNDDDFNDENIKIEPIRKKAKKNPPSERGMFQYTVSCQGHLQIVLNRYMYLLRYIRKNNEKTWRCLYYNKCRCQASVVTKDQMVVQRLRSHNHPFHDDIILKRVSNGNMFTALQQAENFVTDKKKLSDEAERPKKIGPKISAVSSRADMPQLME